MSDEELRFVPMPRYIMRKNALSMLLRRDNCAGKKLLEIGYGAGEIFNLYEKLGVSADGYDYSETAYEYAREHYKSAHVIREKEQIEKGRYDYVVACEVLEHAEDDVGQLKEWCEYIKKNESGGGKMIISVPAHQSRWDDNDTYAGHFRRYEREELREKLDAAGLQLKKIYTYDFPSCLVLDNLRGISRKKKIERDNLSLDKEQRTKYSGVQRDYNPLVLALSHPAIQVPISKFEQLFYKTDWGSAYILIADKK